MSTLILIVFIFFCIYTFSCLPLANIPNCADFLGRIFWRYLEVLQHLPITRSFSLNICSVYVLSPSSSFTVNYCNYKLIRLWNLAINFASQQQLVRTNWGVIWQTAQTYKVPALQVISLKSIWLYNLKKNKNKKLKSYHSFHSLHFFSKNRITLTSSTWFAKQNRT